MYANSRAQFHPAAYALLFATVIVALMTVVLFVLSLIFKLLGTSAVTLDYETNAAVFGPVIFGELVRGHVRHWLGYTPDRWCFPAIGIAGFSAGAVFGTSMALKWGRAPWLELLGATLGVAALYLFVGWLMSLDEKKKRAAQ